MNKKSFFLIIIAAFSLVTFWNITTTSSRRAKAQIVSNSHQINVLLSPQNAGLNVNDTQNVKVAFSPVSPIDAIHALYVQFNAEPGLQILDISRPAAADGSQIKYTEYIRYIQPDHVQIAYDFTTSSSGAVAFPPHSLVFNVLVKKTSTPSATLTLDKSSSSVYFNYDPNSYTAVEFIWGQVDSFISAVPQIVTLPPSATPAPTIPAGPTFTPTPNPTMILSGVPTFAPGGQCQELSPPQNLNPRGTIYVTADGQKISWDIVSGARYYGIEIWEESKTKPTGTQGVTYTKVFTTSTEQTFYIYKQFVQDKNYLIKVSAIDACNNAWMQTQSAITVAGTEPTASPTAVPFPSATPTPAIPLVTIKMRLRLQGIYSQPNRTPKAPKVFLVWVRNSDRDNPIYKWVTAKYDQTGSWFITDTWNLVPGDGYKVWIKGEKHLQRKICDGKPSDQESGFYRCGDENGQIVIRPGENYLDFSNVIMFAGDLPFKGEGDGVLDAFDLAYIATHFSDTTNDIADLNYDGITDSQDYGIAVNAIRIQKYDETYPYKIHPFFRNVPLHEAFP